MRDETIAFEHFARCYPDNAVLLIDTYRHGGGCGQGGLPREQT